MWVSLVEATQTNKALSCQPCPSRPLSKYCLFTFSEESQTGGKVLGYTTSSVYEFFRSLGFVAYTDTIPGYFITFPGNKEQNAYFNSTSNVFPLVYTLTGAALVAYVSKSAA